MMSAPSLAATSTTLIEASGNTRSSKRSFIESAAASFAFFLLVLGFSFFLFPEKGIPSDSILAQRVPSRCPKRQLEGKSKENKKIQGKHCV
jgi:hypothetical protein